MAGFDDANVRGVGRGAAAHTRQFLACVQAVCNPLLLQDLLAKWREQGQTLPFK